MGNHCGRTDNLGGTLWERIKGNPREHALEIIRLKKKNITHGSLYGNNCLFTLLLISLLLHQSVYQKW